MAAPILGIDIGGSGIKGNLVDPASGALVSERHKILTPRPATPAAVGDVVAAMARHFGGHGPIGCTFPAIVRRGVALSAANVDPSWIGADAAGMFSAATGRAVTVVNDADAAGVAEVAHGAARDIRGVVVLLTFGTGIGSALFVDGVLVPNTELGHLHFDGHAPVESWAAARVRKEEGLSWKAWGTRVNSFVGHLDRVLTPDLVVIGGGVSRRWEKWASSVTGPVHVVPAALQNEAGIVGAAMVAAG